MSKIIAFLGLGTMGGAMTTNLVKAGYTVRGYDPSEDASARAEREGVEIHPSAASAVSGAEVVCSSVPGPEDVRAVYLGEAGVLAAAAEGCVCFDFSTITPEASCEVAEEAARRGVHFLDTPVSGSAPRAVTADLAVMAGGDEDAMERHRDVLEAVARSVTYFGANGMGLRMKLIANHLVSGQLCILAEAMTLGVRVGLDADYMTAYLMQSGVLEALKTKAVEMAKKDYTPMFMTDLMAKDLRQVAAMAESAHAPIPFGALAKQVFSGAQALGHGRDDQNAIREYFERLSG